MIGETTIAAVPSQRRPLRDSVVFKLCVIGALILALLVKAYRNPAPTAVAVGLVVLATVAIMTVTNKTLSPQYLLWLGGPMAALLLLREDESPEEQRALGRLAGQLLALALLTHLVFPLLYDGLLGRQGPAMVVVSSTERRVARVAIHTSWRATAAPP